jgi:flagellar protein FliS
MYQNVVNSYQQTQFFTTHPLKLVLMCYEGAIGSLKLARDSYVAGRFEDKAKALRKCIDIIHELNASLDLVKGGECAVNLRNLYAYVTQALMKADLKRDIKAIDRVITMLEELESAWKAASEFNTTDTVENMPRPEISRGAGTVAVSHTWSV